MIFALILTACAPPCDERAGVYSLLDDNGLEWNLRMAPDTTQYFNGKTMEYTLGVQVPAQDNASLFILADRFGRDTCRQESITFSGVFIDGSDVEGVYFSNGQLEAELDRAGNLYLNYSVVLVTPEDQQSLAAEVIVPRVSTVEDWTGDTGDSWY